jgi:hypothetical protein
VRCTGAACALLFAAAFGDVAASSWQAGGDLRGGWYAGETRSRNGDESAQDAVNLRLRLSLQRALGERWSWRGRLAGRYSSDQHGGSAYLHGYPPTRSGSAFGDTTLDEFQFAWRTADGAAGIRFGRLQSKFELPGVAAKSLDHNDSPNIDVNWTDGVHVDNAIGGGWRAHALLQHRHRRGSSSVARAPLDFRDDGSRVSGFFALQNTEPLGPLVLRMLSLSWLPDSLASDGIAAARREDYWTLTARAAAQWPLGDSGTRFLLGLEAGYAPHTPLARATSSGEQGSAGGTAWQTQISLYDIRPGHHLGVALGRVDAGWLLSPDFRNNDRLAEVRYQWKIAPKSSIEVRLRERREIDLPASALQPRRDHDLYLRLSQKF